MVLFCVRRMAWKEEFMTMMSSTLPQARFEEAGLLSQRALEIVEKVRGPDHPDVAAVLHDRANLLAGQVSTPCDGSGRFSGPRTRRGS